MPSNLVIEFDEETDAEHFLDWLSEQGEQDYFTYLNLNQLDNPRVIYHDDLFVEITYQNYGRTT